MFPYGRALGSCKKQWMLVLRDRQGYAPACREGGGTECREARAAEPAHLSTELPPPGWWAPLACTCAAHRAEILVYFYQLPFSQLQQRAVWIQLPSSRSPRRVCRARLLSEHLQHRPCPCPLAGPCGAGAGAQLPPRQGLGEMRKIASRPKERK